MYVYTHVDANVDVQDVRAARLRKLGSQKPDACAESSLVSSRTESSQGVSENKQTVRKRLDVKTTDTKNNADDKASSGNNKKLNKPRLLNTSIDKKGKDYQQAQAITKERSPGSVIPATAIRAASTEQRPVSMVTPVTGTLISDQRELVDDIHIRIADVPEEDVVLKHPPGVINSFENL